VTIDVRATTPDEFRTAADAFLIALMATPPDDEAWERTRPSWDEMSSVSAWDGERCVGHAGQFIVDTTVPGGARLPTGAVSRVGVLPTHRRRGIATGLMRAMVADAVRRELVLMSLRASEAVIYQRFGFGVAGDYSEVHVIPARATPIAGAARDGSMRILDPGEIIDVVTPLYDRVAHRRPGIVTRPPSWWGRYFRSAIERSSPSFVAVHADADGRIDGYVHYDVKWDDDAPDGPTGTGEVNDAFGADDAVELALWQYVFELDLVTRWKATERPIDDLLRLAVHDQRAYHVKNVDDEQWLRVVDVDAALSARSYQPVAGSVAIAVDDPLVPGNNGTWRVSADGVERCDDEPDLSAGIAAVSAAYMGGRAWSALAGIGAVAERRAGSVATADALFFSSRAPFCGSFF
jgi:predicted acetyltransferase